MSRMQWNNAVVTEQAAIIAAEATIIDYKTFGYDEEEYPLAA